MIRSDAAATQFHYHRHTLWHTFTCFPLRLCWFQHIFIMPCSFCVMSSSVRAHPPIPSATLLYQCLFCPPHQPPPLYLASLIGSNDLKDVLLPCDGKAIRQWHSASLCVYLTGNDVGMWREAGFFFFLIVCLSPPPDRGNERIVIYFKWKKHQGDRTMLAWVCLCTLEKQMSYRQ